MSLNNSLITKLRESSLTVNEQSCPGHSRSWEIPPPFLSGVGHFLLQPPSSATLQYKAICR